ncbi:predicted protein [Nematostella vectensis]|uniref:Cilia- and flagella-associated protein 97 n=1 Tax=Nematostella vectensis TaxID=45351 RepID=A7SNW1_NEMVE|nr:predicted protein [Nematostella vectensis]|eukprot:XP_001626716.1 predicted protein [Nematostella vectensis]
MAAKLGRRNSTGNLKDEKAVDRLKKEHFLKPDSDQVDLKLLLQAVLDISDKLDQKTESERDPAGTRPSNHHTTSQSFNETRDFDQRSTTSSSRSRPRSAVKFNESKMPAPQERKNLSFSNLQVSDIDRENQRLLRQITKAKGRVRPRSAVYSAQRVFTEPLRVQTASEVNRTRFQRRVDAENQQILQRLQAVRPTKSLCKDQLSKEAVAQKQFCLNASKTRPSSSRPSSARPSSASRRASSRSRGLARTGSETSLLTNNTASVASSRPSSASRRSSAHRRTRSSNKPVWESGW